MYHIQGSYDTQKSSSSSRQYVNAVCNIAQLVRKFKFMAFKKAQRHHNHRGVIRSRIGHPPHNFATDFDLAITV
jgi:hypothetical protein